MMYEMAMDAIAVFIGLAAANFCYQVFGAEDWETAIERTIFQAVAIGTLLLILSQEVTR